MKQALAHVAVVVNDYDEAIQFYTEILGFDLLEDTFIAEQNKRWVLVSPRGGNGCAILLARASTAEQSQVVGKQTGGRVFLFLSTDDFWRDYKKYMGLGVVFVREPVEAEYGTVAVFEDIYGNRWDLIEYKAGHRFSQRQG